MVGLAKLQFHLQQLRYRRRASKTPLAPFYAAKFPNTSKTVALSRFLVIDCEMSGLNPNEHQLLSIAWIIIENGRIQCADRRHFLINAEGGAGESVLIHGLHDHMLAGGNSVVKALMLLVQEAKNSVLVFHHAPLDLEFLQRASRRHFHCPLLFPYIDTLAVEKKRLALQGRHGGLRLQQCRERYGLPATAQHNALSDARATAELFLAQVHYSGDVQSLPLSHLDLSCS
jgi:DNA polymerase-3 subunit epsilon